MTFERVKTVLAQVLSTDDCKITAQTQLSELDLDSFEAVELLSLLQDEFSVKIKTGYIKKLKTVDDIVRLIEKLQN